MAPLIDANASCTILLKNGYSRSRDDNFRIFELLIKFGSRPILIRRGYQSMALIFNPFPESQLILGCAQELWNLLGVLLALRVL